VDQPQHLTMQGVALRPFLGWQSGYYDPDCETKVHKKERWDTCQRDLHGKSKLVVQWITGIKGMRSFPSAVTLPPRHTHFLRLPTSVGHRDQPRKKADPNDPWARMVTDSISCPTASQPSSIAVTTLTQSLAAYLPYSDENGCGQQGTPSGSFYYFGNY
jgi:hypothetical protein